MIYDPNTTTTFPSLDAPNGGYTLDQAFHFAQESGWTSYFGGLFAWALFACFIIQVYFYYTRFPHDRCLIKGTVMLLIILEVSATAFLTWAGYVSHVLSWGHSIVFKPAIWGLMLFDCTVAFVVHALYAWRIYKLISRRWLAASLTTIIMMLSAAQVSCCIAAAMYNATQKRFAPSHSEIGRKMFHGWLTAAILADVVITTTMAIKLFSARTGVPSTDKSITKLLYVFIPGGAVTALVTLAILIIQLRYTGTDYYQMLIICLTKFYSNSVLLCLNLRSSSSTNSEKRNTMLPTFGTSQGISSSGQPFDIKIERCVEKCTSSGTYQRDVPSDGVDSSSEYGMMEVGGSKKESFYACKGLQDDIPIDIDALSKIPFPVEDDVDSIVLASSSPIVKACHCHPFQSTVSVGDKTVSKRQSEATLTSTEAMRGHDVAFKKEALNTSIN